MSNYWKSRKLQNKLFDEFEANINSLLAKDYIATYNRVLKQLEDTLIKLEASWDKVLISHLYQYDKYYSVLNDLAIALHELGVDEVKTIEDRFVNYYKEHCSELDKCFGLPTSFNEDNVRRTINSIWCADNKSWSDRVWQDKDALGEKLRQSLVDTITSGRSHKELSKELAEQFSTSFSNAERLVRTELTHIQTEASLEKYKEAGIEYFDVLSEGDCCEHCKSHKRIPIAGAVTGENTPPFHPFADAVLLHILENSLQHSLIINRLENHLWKHGNKLKIISIF